MGKIEGDAAIMDQLRELRASCEDHAGDLAGFVWHMNSGTMRKILRAQSSRATVLRSLLGHPVKIDEDAKDDGVYFFRPVERVDEHGPEVKS